MKVLVKEYMMGMLDSVELAIDQLIDVKYKKNERIEILGTCQEVLINIAGALPEDYDEIDNILKLIDDGTKKMFIISNLDENSLEWNNELDQLKTLVKNILENIKRVPVEKAKALFLPLSVENWSSMASIYEVFKQDQRFDAKVMPVPYFEYGPSGTIADNKWEYDAFEKLVGTGVVDYNEYNLEEEHPEVVFINDPYDSEGEYIRVQPKYFSDEILNKTDHLVYVSPEIRDSHSNVKYGTLPGIKNAWKIIVGNEIEKKDFIRSGVDESKIISLGSARKDVINNHGDLKQGIFELNFIDEKGIENTTDLLNSFSSLEKSYENSSIKWFDNLDIKIQGKRDTDENQELYNKAEQRVLKLDNVHKLTNEKKLSSIESAAFYIGQGDSWMANLLADKNVPVLKRKPGEELKASTGFMDNPLIGFSASYVIKDKDIYCYSRKFNGILHLDLSRASMEIEKGDEAFDKSIKNLYGDVCVDGNRLLFSPINSGKVMEKNIVTGEKRYFENDGFYSQNGFDILATKDFYVLMPRGIKDSIYYINKKTGEINQFDNYYDASINALEYVKENELFVAREKADGVIYRSIITNSLVQAYDANTADFRYGILGENKGQIWDLAYDGKYLWCIDFTGMNVIMWNRTKNVISRIEKIMDDSCQCIKPCDKVFIEGNHRWFISADRTTILHMDKKCKKRITLDVTGLNVGECIAFAIDSSLYIVADGSTLRKVKYINKGGDEYLECENLTVKWDKASINDFMYKDSVFNMTMMGLDEFISYISSDKRIDRLNNKNNLSINETIDNENYGEKIAYELIGEIFQ